MQKKLGLEFGRGRERKAGKGKGERGKGKEINKFIIVSGNRKKNTLGFGTYISIEKVEMYAGCKNKKQLAICNIKMRKKLRTPGS